MIKRLLRWLRGEPHRWEGFVDSPNFAKDMMAVQKMADKKAKKQAKLERKEYMKNALSQAPS